MFHLLLAILCSTSRLHWARCRILLERVMMDHLQPVLQRVLKVQDVALERPQGAALERQLVQELVPGASCSSGVFCGSSAWRGRAKILLEHHQPLLSRGHELRVGQ